MSEVFDLRQPSPLRTVPSVASNSTVAPETGQAHPLKTWPQPFGLVWAGVKPFEVRKDDRGYKVGDYLVLREWDPSTEAYSGRRVEATVTCIVRDAWGLPPGLVVMGIREVQRAAVQEGGEG